jgi:subtilisin-like proprotein convertase family protein
MNRWRNSFWLLLSLACFIAAFVLYFLFNPEQAKHSAASGSNNTVAVNQTQPVTKPIAPSQTQNTNASTAAAAARREERLKYRLSNTTQTVGELTRNDKAILLENALIDSSKPLNFSIPDSLKAKGDPGTYIVQSRGLLNNNFRAALAAAGATIVSYIPNNAYLVRASAEQAQQLSANGLTQSVLPFEPYYKLDLSLLKTVMEQKRLPLDTVLNVVVFSDARDATISQLRQLNAQVMSENPSPFGPLLTVKPADGTLTTIAGLSGVQTIGTYTKRTTANDLSRPRVGVAADSVTPDNYLNLSGSNVWVAVNDSGVDATHPDFSNPTLRVFSPLAQGLVDTSGHGTHVAGTIAGNGFESTTVVGAIGSIMPGTNGQFRGMAPLADIFSMPLSLPDFQLQEAAARTNAYISNNSWNYGSQDYDINAASYDAAVRDALPEVIGSQPLVFVFSAGNGGNLSLHDGGGAGGGDNGLGGNPESINSPATAKNVITVGAIEQPRNITNSISVDNSTNQPWIGSTDSGNQVASFSARGNVGIGIEGDNGRFKPDVVAPGTFVISTRSQQWDTNAYYSNTNFEFNTFAHQVATTNGLNNYSVFIPGNALELIITVNNTNGLDMPIYVNQTDIPTTNDFVANNQYTISIPALTMGNTLFYSVGDPTNVPVNYSVSTVIVSTNDVGSYYQVLQQMNDSLGGTNGQNFYRYESGTSMAAADVSGVLALIEDFFTNQLGRVPSPALLKAMLINGARSANIIYDFQVQNTINYQGWGLVNITNSIPMAVVSNNPASSAIATALSQGPSPLLLFDQSPTNALATGDSRTIKVAVDPAAGSLPMRVTLVWTDPAGNPAAGVKLVNNLDLVVTNLDTGDVFFGNDFNSGANFVFAWDTNTVPNRDTVNNVENVYLAPTLGTNYSITVIGRSVNVNAVTAETNNIVQDYALAISSGNGQVSNALTLVSDLGIATTGYTNLTILTNQFASGDPNAPIFGEILNPQYVGANSPLIGTNTVPYQAGNGTFITLGETNQWHFYLITNATDFTNAVFATSLPIDLAAHRMGVTNVQDPTQIARQQADIDLYVTKDPLLLTLDSNAVANADKSLGRGGYEQIIYTNAEPNAVYYIGVKSEDQQAAQYQFTVLFSLLPFNNGNGTYQGYPTMQPIPDGSPALPGVATVTAYAAATGNSKVRQVIVSNILTHENLGDLLGTLSHDGEKNVTLNNHTFGNGNLTQEFIYDDTGNTPGAVHTDGPGSLTDYIGDDINGQWTLTEIDNALTHTGRIDNLTIHIEPHVQNDLPPGGTNGIVLANCVTVQPNAFQYDFVDVPFNGTDVQLCISNTQPVQLFIRNNALPTLTAFDYSVTITNGGCFDVSIFDLPPLQAGTLYFGIYNPNAAAQDVCYTASLTINPVVVQPTTFTATNTPTIKDDAITYSTVTLTNNQPIASVGVGVAINYPRVSDLVLTLISPAGKRYTLFDERGALTSTNLGHINITTNFFGSATAGDANANTNVLFPVPTSGTLLINYDFFTVPDSMIVYYDGLVLTNTGLISGAGTLTIPYGPGIGNSITIVMNQGGNPNQTAWTYTPSVVDLDYTYFTFTENPDQAQTPVKFAGQPYDLFDFGSNYFLSDFESATNGDYFAYTSPSNIPDAFGGWNLFTNDVFVGTNILHMTSNQVSVVTDPWTAQSGSNYLALANGSITRVVPTRPGRNYTITYFYRGPGISGWWRGEGNPNDSSDPEAHANNADEIGRFEYPAGHVGQAFQFEDAGQVFRFAGTNTYLQVRQSASLDVGEGGGFTVEGWINPTNVSFQQPLVEWLAPVPTNWVHIVPSETNVIVPNYDTNMTLIAGPFLNPATSHYYYLLASTNWTTSELWANQLGGHLADVEDANEENWIYDTFAQYAGTNRALWIGLTNTPGTTNYMWSSGQTNVFYTNWVSGQPFNCTPTSIYTAIINPTNLQPGLWTLADDTGRTCWQSQSNHIFGVVEVNEIQTNGVQLWVSITNSVISSNGCLYADIVDTSNVSHLIYSAPGLIQSNIYQHVALTYNTNTGVANLYYNGTNVATTNFGVAFVPKTGGDVLFGKDMSRGTNTYYAGKQDEMSIYSRALSPSEIAAIYQGLNTYYAISTNSLATNYNAGKFDPTITPALGLAEAQVAIAGLTNRMLGMNTTWQIGGSSFTATTDSVPVQITGVSPGMLLDSFAVNQQPPGNIYYLPEQAMSDLIGQSSAGTWTLEIRDARAGPLTDTNLLGQLVSWQMQFIYRATQPVSIPLNPFETGTNVVPAGKTAYFTVDVPEWASYATNVLVSATAPVSVWFNQTNPPTGGPNDTELITPQVAPPAGIAVLVTNGINGLPPLLPGQRYYLGVSNAGPAAATIALRVDFDITTLSNGVPVTTFLNTNLDEQYFAYDVSSNAVEATFQLLQVSNNVDLVVSRGLPLPTLTNSDFGSFNGGSADEDIYVLTNSYPVALAPGRWYLGVFKRVPQPASFAVLAKELDPQSSPPVPNIIDLTNGIPRTFTADPGAALTNFFRFAVTNSPQAIHFELFNMTGNADLTVQTNLLPLSPPFFGSSRQPGNNAELIFIHTNSAVTNLNADWYLGVPTHETNVTTFTILAVIDTNSYFPAFPGAEGAGGGTVGGGRIGLPVGITNTVYHVTTLNDSGLGSLRDAVSTTNRTIVFDLSGTIHLLSPLIITNSYLTIAGQTAPGDGITVAGDMTAIQSAHDIIIRYLRFRRGDFAVPSGSALVFDTASNVIADHISATWSTNANVSVLNSTNVTVQWSVISDALYITNQDRSGFGSRLRFGAGALSFHHNLYADNYYANPRVGDNITLDFVDNVIYNWGTNAGFSLNDSVDNPLGFTNYLNYICNYLIAGPDTAAASTPTIFSTNIAFWGGTTNTWIFQTNNFIDSNTNGILDGANTGWNMFTNLFTKTNHAFALPAIGVDEAFLAYEKVLDFAGAAMDKRDSADLSIVGGVRAQTGRIISTAPALPLLNSTNPPMDTDQDGIPDFWEITLGENPTNFSANVASTSAPGYSTLEEYLNWLGAPHALTLTNTSVDVDLYKLTGSTGNLTYFVTNAINGTVYLTNRYYITNANGFVISNTVAVFSPTNVPTNYFGFASFDFYVTNTDTVAYFGPTKVSVFVSAVPVTNASVVAPVVILTNQNSYCSTNLMATNEVDYYAYDVSANAYGVQFQVSGSTNLDLYLRFGPPLPGPGSFDYAVTNSGANVETITVLTNMIPVPITNGFWYLAVSNSSGTSPVSYCVSVTEFTNPPPVIIPLTNGIPYLNTNNAGTNALDYYVYTVSTNAIAVQFEVDNPSADVTLVARKGPQPPLPSLTTYDYISANPGTSNELIMVWTNSTPVPLAPGDWYLAVANVTGGNVSYSIKATEITNNFPGIITLTNAISYVASNSPAGGTDYYRFVVPTNSARAQFEVNHPDGDVTLVLRKGLPLPSLTNYDYISANSYTNDELIVVFTNSTPVALTPGDWYLSVVNVSGGAVDYSVKATAWSVTGEPIIITSETYSGGDLCITWDSLPGVHYFIQGIPSLSGTNWVTIVPDILATNYSTEYCIPLPSTNNFFRVGEGLVLSTNVAPLIVNLTNLVPYSATNSMGTNGLDFYRYNVSANATGVVFKVSNLSGDVALVARKGLPLPSLSSYDYITNNPGTNDEIISVFTNSAPVPLSPGDWYLAVANLSGPPVAYTITASELTNNASVVTLTNGIAYFSSNSGAGSATDYYRYTVTNNPPARAQFEVDNPSGDVILLARKNLPLPASTNFDYISQNPGTNDELIVVLTNSTPIALSAGDWYLAVINASGGPVSYSVKATEWPVTGQPINIISIQYSPPTGTNPGCLNITWSSLPGVYYHIEGVPTLTATNWAIASPTILATTNTTSYCVPLPSTNNFFRVEEGLALSTSSVPAPVLTVTYTGGGFLLQWTGPSTASYQPQWSPVIPTSSWNSFTNVITSATGQFSFLDNGSQTGGFGSTRFYRVIVLP